MGSSRRRPTRSRTGCVLGATKSDFYDADGKPLPRVGVVLRGDHGDDEPEREDAEQFDATDMTNFETMVNLYARLASGVSSMPIEYFGLNTQNAPSAEGQRAGETRLIKKAERKQVAFGHAWEAAMRLVLRFRNGGSRTRTRSCGAWRRCGATRAPRRGRRLRRRDGEAVQVGLVDWETAQEDLGRTPAQIEQMKKRRLADARTDLGFGESLADPGAA
jgi:hypothetical protein